MEALRKIRFIQDVDFLKSPHCNYLTKKEMEEVKADYAKKTSLIFGAVVNESAEFVFTVDLTPHSLHVRHVVGHFARYYRELDSFVNGLAAICGYGQVTFCSKRRAIAERWAKEAGYDKMPMHEINFEFVKRVN